jgi:hypothetical protein
MATTPAAAREGAAIRAQVGAALKAYLASKNMTVRSFNEEVLKVRPNSVVAYNWLAGRGLPSNEYIRILAKTLDKPEEFFRVAVKTAKVAKSGNGHAKKPAQITPEAQAALDSPPPVSSVVTARNPRQIRAEQLAKAAVTRAVRIANVEEAPDEAPRKNSLVYMTNDDGTASVFLSYTAARPVVRDVLSTLLDLDIDDTQAAAEQA